MRNWFEISEQIRQGRILARPTGKRVTARKPMGGPQPGQKGGKRKRQNHGSRVEIN
jgi:hypothetical protein